MTAPALLTADDLARLQLRVARAYRADGTVSLMTDADILDGEEALPGFSCTLREIL